MFSRAHRQLISLKALLCYKKASKRIETFVPDDPDLNFQAIIPILERDAILIPRVQVIRIYKRAAPLKFTNTSLVLRKRGHLLKFTVRRNQK